MSETVSFEADIKPLFRERDQRSMVSHFDLWDYDDVKANAAAILEAVRGGSMPCDGEWPADSVAKFKSWVDSNYPA